MTAGTDPIRARLADMIVEASGRELRAEDVLAGDHPLSALGLTSLARISLIDAVEDAFDCQIDLGGPLASFEYLDVLATHLARLGAGDPAGPPR
ncbi:acyl carrier protein [Acrocarpospora catenulata]|uniref:acyl carrier protein n=1 Tax=Acrocarpospora catenulata TaxID=2836182 RepID=UPI001BDA1C9C|nr:acyl carrier protein [Acrocarpospora catenulata]